MHPRHNTTASFPGARRKTGTAGLQRFRQGHGVLMDGSPLNGAGQQVGLSPLSWGICGTAPGNPPAQGHPPHMAALLNQQLHPLMTVVQVKTYGEDGTGPEQDSVW